MKTRGEEFKIHTQPKLFLVTFNKGTYIKHLVWKLDGSVATCLVVVGSHLLVLHAHIYILGQLALSTCSLLNWLKLRLSNEVFEDLIPRGSSLVLVPQTSGVKNMVSPKFRILINCFLGSPRSKIKLVLQ